MTKETGFLLSYIKYGDNDAVLHCFTKEAGFSSYFVRGIYSSKNKKKAYLLALNELEITFNGKHSTLKQVSRIEQIHNRNLYFDVKANAVMFFVADFLHQILKNETAQHHLYELIQEFINEIEEENFQAYFIFLVKIISFQGIAPSVSNQIYLDPETGIFTEKQKHNLFDLEISELWREILQQNISYEIRIDKQLRRRFLESILVYYQCHFSEFKTPKSLEIVNQIFE